MPKFVLGGATGLLVRGNIDIDARTFVAVPVGGGKFASVRTVSWHLEPEDLFDRYGIDTFPQPAITAPPGLSAPSVPRTPVGGEVLVPTVIRRGNKWVVVHDLGALAHYQSTGRHLGIFDTPAHATAYANALHLEQAAAAAKRRRLRQRRRVR